MPLAGAGSAGYAWTWEVDGDAGAVEVELRSSGPPRAVRPGAAPAGGSVPHSLVIRGRSPGRATIRLRLSRSFEPQRAPREARDVIVAVDPAD